MPPSPSSSSSSAAAAAAAAAGGGVHRDWSGLTPDVLAHIAANRLTSVDYLTFRTVCRSWASAAEDVLPAPHVPYLLLPPSADSSRSGGGGDLPADFLSLPDGTFRRFPVPKLRGRYCVGSQHGWLATIDCLSCDVSLLNPFTGREIALPPLTTLSDGYIACACSSTPGSYPRRIHKAYCVLSPACGFCFLPVLKVVISSDPDHDPAAAGGGGGGGGGGAFTAAALVTGLRDVIFTRAGESKWSFCAERAGFHDLLFHRGSLLGLDMNGAAHAIELGSRVGDHSAEIRLIARAPSFLAEFSDQRLAADAGGILGVFLRDDSFRKTTSRIYVLRACAEKRKWALLRSLDGFSLFVGVCSSVVLSAEHCRGLKENCVYFADHYREPSGDEREDSTPAAGVYNLKTGAFKSCHAPGDHRFSWPPPIWISPSLSSGPLDR